MASVDIKTQQTSMKGLGRHAVMAELQTDEESLLNYQMALSRHLREHVQPRNIEIFEKRVRPTYQGEYGHEPKNRHEVRKAMLKDPAYCWWACLRRHLQEQGSGFKLPMIDRQTDELIKRSKHYSSTAQLGSLELDSDLPFPTYQTSMDMHWAPGGYYAEATKGDVFAGALYDLGGLYMGTGGKMGPYNDGPGWAVVNWLETEFPDFRPETILDEGCTVGHSTLAYADAWPESEVIGIDFAAPVLRYAHARAEAMGRKVHFKQRLAEKTRFADASFDLVVSSMFLHETSNRAIHELIAEARRILKPGGLMLHVEQPPFTLMTSIFQQFEMDWDTHNNNEPFWGPMHDMDLEKVALSGGFEKNKILQTFCPFVVPRSDGSMDIASKGEWFLFGAWR